MVDPPNQNVARVGIEISDAGLNVAIVNVGGTLETARSIPIADASETVPALIALVSELEKEFGVARMGLALPGLVDRRSGRVAYSANIPRHAEVNLVDDVKAATGLAIVIENDANAAAYG